MVTNTQKNELSSDKIQHKMLEIYPELSILNEGAVSLKLCENNCLTSVRGIEAV